jgi:hypothetical protein
MLYLRLEPGCRLPKYDGPCPFRAIVVVEEPVTEEWRWEVCKWLVAADCRYMMAWGIEASAWDDDVDMADLEAHDFQVEDEVVMTTWHDDETLADVFEFARNCAIAPGVGPDATLVVHVSRDDRRREFERLYHFG